MKPQVTSELMSRAPVQPFATAAAPNEAPSTATVRTFAILDLIAHAQAPVEVSSVIDALGLSKATAYRLVDGLVSSGYLAREPARKRLTVGSRLTDLAFCAMRASMRDAGRHALLRRLVHEVNETCNIGIMLHGEIVYLDRVEADHWPLRLQFGPGSRVPLHCSAIGKLFLALTPSRRRRRLLENLELRRFTETTMTARAQLEAELKQIRGERVSFDRQEYLVGVVCMAVPVMAKSGEALAAIAIQAPEARMNVAAARDHLPALRRAAAELADTFQGEF